MKVIFLDVDGVINLVWPLTPKEERDARDELEFKIFEKDGYRILSYPNYRAIKLINKLTEETGAKIVVSSSWRSTNGNTWKIRKTFEECGLEVNVIDETPFFSWNAIRGKEIKAWLDKTELSVESFLILDDDSDMLEEQLPNFIKTDPYDGFDFANFLQALKILGHEGTH